jgi:cytochrome P450
MSDADISIPPYPMKRDPQCPLRPPEEELRLLMECPVAKVRLWDESEPWLITGYDDFRHVLSHPAIGADAMNPGYPRISEGDHVTRQRERQFIVIDGPEHADYRRMLAPFFTIKRMEDLRPRIQEIVDDLIEAMLARPRPADLVTDLALALPSLVICELLGVPVSDQSFFQRTSNTIMSIESTPEESLGAAETILEYLGDMLDRKAQDPCDDVLSKLAVNYMGEGGLSRERLAITARLLLQAGHETTANMIALGVLALLQHPDQLDELKRNNDPILVGRAVEELLRYLSISHAGRRRVALDDIEVGGCLIRKGEGVIGVGETANWDPNVFAEPDRLDISRGTRSHVAFGFGVHQCLGQPMARIELQVVFSTLFERIPSLRLDCDMAELRFKEEMTVYGVRSLPVTWEDGG